MKQEVKRCGWCLSDPLYIEYHDSEWGRVVKDDHLLFEMLILEGFQAGLSWLTILKRREGFRAAFDNFDYHIIAQYPQEKLDALHLDDRIIKNRLKIQAAKTNAQAYLKVLEEFGSFSDYFWGFTNHQVIDNPIGSLSEIKATTPLSDTISKDLKKRGFKFVGSTIIYAYMQAVGMVNDHLADCFVRRERDS